MFHGNISLNSVLLLLLVNFMSGFRLELIVLHLKYKVKLHAHLHGFRLLALLPDFVETTFFVCVNRINLLKSKIQAN